METIIVSMETIVKEIGIEHSRSAFRRPGADNVTDGKLRARAISFFTVESGLISKIVEFWPDPYEPPFDRSEYTERLD